MRAVAVRQLRGEPELMELPEPVPASNEIRIRLAVAGVNPFDRKLIDGVMEGVWPHVFPLVVGVEGAGTVDQVGTNSRFHRVGERLFGQLLHPPVGAGTYAEYITVPDDQPMGRVIDGLSTEQAAALSVAGLTGLGLVDIIGPQPGRSVLIVGATGGVGSFATQLAASRGAHVIATAYPDVEEKVRQWGAAETVDPNRGAVAAQVRSRHPEGIDGLIDVVSDAARFAENSELVKEGGAAATTLAVADAALARQQGIRAVNFDNQPTSEKLERLAEEVAAGRLKVSIERRLPLEQGPEAIALMRSGKARGKTVLRIERD